MERCQRRVKFLFDFGSRMTPAKLVEVWWKHQGSTSPCARKFAEWAFSQAKLKLGCLRPLHEESRQTCAEVERWFKQAPKELLLGCWEIKVLPTPEVVKVCLTTTSTDPMWLRDYLEPN